MPKHVTVWTLMLQSPVATSYATRHEIKNFTFCLQNAFMCFVWISEETPIIFLYNINWLVFITETESVYNAVRTGSLNVIQVNLQMVK